MPTGLRKTVLLLGAGASAASEFQLPTMRGFFGENLDDYPDLREFLERFYPEADRKDYNLEEVLAYLDLSRSRLPLWDGQPILAKEDRFSSLYVRSVEYVKHRLEIGSTDHSVLHTRLFETLRDEDSVLTMNYDLVADQTLLEMESGSQQAEAYTRVSKLASLLYPQSLWGCLQPPSLTPSERAGGFYLKLHGSLDWLCCPNEHCPNHHNIYPLSQGGNLHQMVRSGIRKVSILKK